jgi:hypothetical protein
MFSSYYFSKCLSSALQTIVSEQQQTHKTRQTKRLDTTINKFLKFG